MANFTVTSDQDDEQAPPPGSLRQMIVDANGSPGPDTIGFAITGTIVLSAPLPAITEDLDIVGPGAAVLAISGNNAHRIFTIDPGVNVRVQDLTVRDGFHQVNGAGFFNLGNLALTRTEVVNNTVGFGGGGVYTAADASLSAARSAFRQNRSDNIGGAILMDGARALTITEGLFEENSAASEGGAIWSDTVAPVAIHASRFMRNRASDAGGAIVFKRPAPAPLLLVASDVTIAQVSRRARITSSQFTSNLALAAAGVGGAVAAFADTELVVSASRFATNSAGAAGGAIALTAARMTIAESACSDNVTGDTGGGAISVDDNSSAEIAGSALSGNTAAGSGGAVLINNSVTTMSNVTIARNRAGSTGGATQVTAGSLTMSFVTVADNAVGSGAAVAADTPGIILVKNSIIASTAGGSNCSGNIINGGGNFATDSSCPGFIVVTRAQLNLGPLQINAPGTTETMALLRGSSAIDAAVDCNDVAGTPVLTDQRGVPRPQGVRCDSGAYEAVPVRVRRAQSTPPIFVSDGTCGSQRVRRRNPFLPFTR